jgi:NAD-dependent dihydropyrimidine dehydrogenase PreA subunit
MCTFCVQHGDGKRWYAQAQNYAFDLRSDLRRRGYMVGFARDFERNRRVIDAGLAALRLAPRPIAAAVKERVSAGLQRQHFGQPVPIEECERIFALATNITRLPCVCRGAQRPGSDAESCCLVMTVAPHDDLLAECFAGYAGGPDAEGFQKLEPAQAIAYLRRAEERGLCHTAWTFQTPFIAAICNCDLPGGCMAMKLQLRAGIRIMWKGEDVIRLDPERCGACAQCVPRCPFGALRGEARRSVTVDRTACWGCGTCRAHCARAALALEPRAGTADVAAVW